MPLSVNAAPDKAQYELQERCAKRAEQIFAKDWPHGSPDTSAGYTQTATYQSHYNPTLNKCFMLEISQGFLKERVTLSKVLLDVNANKEYGQFFGEPFSLKPSGLIPMCTFGTKGCASESEWDAMANVYMEEDGTGELPQPGGAVKGR
jgi:hypothetical protein